MKLRLGGASRFAAFSRSRAWKDECTRPGNEAKVPMMYDYDLCTEELQDWTSLDKVSLPLRKSLLFIFQVDRRDHDSGADFGIKFYPGRL